MNRDSRTRERYNSRIELACGAMANVLIEFRNFPQEREIVGRLLIAYGEIEFALVGCLREALHCSASMSTRILFRVRGEGARIEVADAIARPAYNKIGLGGQWGNAIGAACVCKKIRNQYAHCHWRLLSDGVLRFMDLDAEVGGDGPVTAKAIPLKLSLLQRQDEYFEYTLDWLYYLGEEYKRRAGRSSSHDLVKPKSMRSPPLYDRP
jgi:hypothetical protein